MTYPSHSYKILEYIHSNGKNVAVRSNPKADTTHGAERAIP